MKIFLHTAILIGIILISGCKPAVPATIHRIGKAAMGDVHKPRNGEGELFAIDTTLPEGFDRLSVEVTPFEHKIFRMVLDMENIPGHGDALEIAREQTGKIFHIPAGKFKHYGNSMTAVLPGTTLKLYRAFHLGPRAVSLEIINCKLAEQAEKIKQTAIFQTVRKQQQIKQQIFLVAKALEEHKLDTGIFPEKLEHLLENSANTPNWNGSYLLKKPALPLSYHRISDTRYELYADADGKKIYEDTEL